MYNAADRLRELVSDDKVQVMPELHNCTSAKVTEMNGFEVIMVSSGGLACALTGVPDLQLLSIDGFCQATDRITNMTQMPLIIGADNGFRFGRGLSIYVGCKRIMKADAAGMLVTDISELRKAGQFLTEDAVLRFKAAGNGLDMDDRHGFLITQCDTDPEEDFDDCVARPKAYWKAGTDMLYIPWMHKVKDDKYELYKKLRDAYNYPTWHPGICGVIHDPHEIIVEQLKDLDNYKLVGVHYSMHVVMLAMLDVGRHAMMEWNNNYVDCHFDGTGYKCFATMSMFGLTNEYWINLGNSYAREPQDSITRGNYDYLVRPGGVHNPDEEEK